MDKITFIVLDAAADVEKIPPDVIPIVAIIIGVIAVFVVFSIIEIRRAKKKENNKKD